MGLNDIKLSPSVVTALYKSVLVQDSSATDQTVRIETIEERITEQVPEPPPPPGRKPKKTETDATAKKEDPIIGKISITIEEEEEDPSELSPGNKPGKIKTKETILKSLGGNQKNILIVVKNDNITYLPDEDLEFLTNILKACKLSLEDVAIVNTNNNPDEGYKEYLKNWSSKIVLLFGVSPVSFDLPVSFPEFQVQSLTNTKFLYSPALSECRTDKLLKSKLWVSLQRIFGL
jgi:hypothetical protein